MQNHPKISVVTPNFNQGKFIEQTIQSVINQNYPNLEYIIIDGGSTDDSLDIIEKYSDSLAHWESGKDDGMYHAINKGFDLSSGEIMCWVNSDDVLWPNSLHKVAALFNKYDKVKWLMGKPLMINEMGEIIWSGFNNVHSPYFFYLHNHTRSYTFIQQESTFWKRSLWEKTGGHLDTSFNLGADFDLWLRFFKFERLYRTKEKLGAFRRRSGQLSENKDRYIKETNISVSINQRNLSVKDKLMIFILKATRKLFFGIKNKKIKNFFYAIQGKVFGQPKWID